MLSRLDRLGDVPVVIMLPSPHALFGAALDIHRASIGLPPVDNVRDHVLGRATRTRRSSRPFTGAAFRTAMIRWATAGDGAAPLADQVDEAFAMLAGGLATPTPTTEES
ncbi:hypothetical protein [Micromonospora sp. IBHARD004]|uniref:hypothetical protein n=1 Tax=Micromonospora sp. IBHARD004 TaxID=3457764 RepID=UPI0040597A2F